MQRDHGAPETRIARHGNGGAIYSVATPLFGLVFSRIFRGDVLSPWLIFSGLCMAAGILLVNRRPDRVRQFRLAK